MKKEKYVGKEKQKLVWISDDVNFLRERMHLKEAVLLLLTEENRKENTDFCRYAIESEEDLTEEFLEEVYDRFHGIPRVIAITKDFTIREMKSEDVADLGNIFEEEEAGFIEGFFSNVEEGKEYLNQYIRTVYDFYGFGIWGIYCHEKDALIGIVGFTPREESLELGFAIQKEYRRKGYMNIACREVMAYIGKTTDYKIIEANVHDENIASMELLKKLGFQKIENSWKKEIS